MCRFDFKAKLISNGIILVGHSMGAEICMAIAAGYQRSAPESEGYGVCCTCTTSPLVLPTEMQDQQVHAYDSAESVKFTVTNILSSREMLTEASERSMPSYGMREEVAVPQGKGIEVIVMVDENDIVETKKRVLREVAEIKRE